jgi:hypothetical protein
MKKPICGVLSLLVLVAVGPACQKKEAPPTPAPAPITLPPTTIAAATGITNVALGKAVGLDKRVTDPTAVFGPKDTIYAAVETVGTGPAKLRALWLFVKGEKTAKVDETTIELNATAPTVNEFHVSKPSGWPKGDYRLEIFLAESPTPSATRTFKVADVDL